MNDNIRYGLQVKNKGSKLTAKVRKALAENAKSKGDK